MDFEALYAVEELDFYGLSIGEDSPYEWATDEKTEISDKKVFKNKKKLFSPDEIYREAEANTMRAFSI
jgi:hypothetical protein